MTSLSVFICILLLSIGMLKESNDIKKLQQQVSLLEQVKPQGIQVNTFGELNDIKPQHRALVVAIAMTESNCNYNVKHPTNETKGIGGIKPAYWTLKSNINSLKAIEEIIIHLENKGKTPYEVIKYYKGAKTNLKSTQQCWDLYKRLKGIL